MNNMNYKLHFLDLRNIPIIINLKNLKIAFMWTKSIM